MRVGLDGLVFLVVHEDLFWAVILVLEHEVVSSEGKDSVSSHLIDNSECSSELEAESVSGSSCGSNGVVGKSVGVDDLPSLVCSVVSVPYNDLSSFYILVTGYVKYLSSLDVLEYILLVSEELPPLTVGLPHLNISLFS